ncbi:PDZ and LIM domain protein 2 isoform X2 [Protopterus annectens]|uniref:PDZ and LIM domain protein 2 isoform X2 n=1 Tax=Protopterus annectens TaxID=7888 RepID=UPI001CFA211F|nr:PDZ and LIM domain protein 2 isoform X2 [Protopterus annectens]
MSRVVTIPGPAPWGFRISGGRDFKKPVTISKVNEGSKAEKADLRCGDVILAINESSTEEMLNAEAQNLIKTSPSKLQLIVQRPVIDVTHHTNGLSSPDTLSNRFHNTLNTGRRESDNYGEYNYSSRTSLSPSPNRQASASPVVFQPISYTSTSPTPPQRRSYSPVSPSFLHSNFQSPPRPGVASRRTELKVDTGSSFQASPVSPKLNNTDISYYQPAKIRSETARPGTPTKMAEQGFYPVSSPKLEREVTGHDVRRSTSPIPSPSSYSKPHAAVNYNTYSPRSPREFSNRPMSPANFSTSPGNNSLPRQSSPDPSITMKRFEEESEVYKMLQENREAKAPPRQSKTFSMLQEVLETDEKEAAVRFPGRLSTSTQNPVPTVAGVQKFHICEKCNTSIV